MVFPVVIAHMAMIFTSFTTLPAPHDPGPLNPTPLNPAPLDPRSLTPGPGSYPPGTPIDTPQSGITGTVYRLSGNHMPAPNRPASPPAGVRATVCVYELTSDTQVTHLKGSPSYYQAVHTRLICQVETDPKGFFQVMIPPGTYSVFTKKGNLFYASRRDEKNNIAPVEVLPGKMTQVQCSVESDHKAVF